MLAGCRLHGSQVKLLYSLGGRPRELSIESFKPQTWRWHERMRYLRILAVTCELLQ